MNTVLKTVSTFAAAGVLSATMAGYVHANHHMENHKDNSRWTEVMQKSTVTDQQLMRYAELQSDVAEIEQGYSLKLHSAPNDIAKQSVVRKATISKYSVISDAGFDYDLYEAIDVAVKTDPAVRARLKNLTGVDVPVDMINGVAYTPKTQREPIQTNKVRADFSNKKLKKFAAVQDEIKTIRTHYAEKITASDSVAHERDLLVEAHREIAKAIENVGLYREEYANISLSMKQDPKLRSKVQTMIQQSS